MNFKNWMEVFDDVENTPISRVYFHKQYSKYGTQYTYRFRIDGEPFIVELDGYKYEVDPEGKTHFVGNIEENPQKLYFIAWSITFINALEKNGMQITNLARNHFRAYKQLLLAINKLMNIEKVEALSFYGMDSKQNLIYQTFFKKYLYGKFVYYQNNIYVTKDLFKRISQYVSGESEDNKMTFRQNYQYNIGQHNKGLQDIRKQKNAERNQYINNGI